MLRKAGAPIPRAGRTWLAAGIPLPEIADPPAAARGWVSAYEAASGAVRRKRAMPHPVLAAVTPTRGGLVFTAGMGGQLYALDAADGRILRQLESGQSTGAA